MNFNQRTGAPQAVCWSKKIFDAKTSFSVTNRKKGKAAQKYAKTFNKRGVYQRLGVLFNAV